MIEQLLLDNSLECRNSSCQETPHVRCELVSARTSQLAVTQVQHCQLRQQPHSWGNFSCGKKPKQATKLSKQIASVTHCTTMDNRKQNSNSLTRKNGIQHIAPYDPLSFTHQRLSLAPSRSDVPVSLLPLRNSFSKFSNIPILQGISPKFIIRRQS